MAPGRLTLTAIAQTTNILTVHVSDLLLKGIGNIAVYSSCINSAKTQNQLPDSWTPRSWFRKLMSADEFFMEFISH